MADRTVSVKLRADISDYVAKMRGSSAATRDAEKSARDLRKALDDEEAAAGRVRVAEARLNEVRADGKAKASQLAAAEEDLARAHRQHEQATDRVTQANDRYQASVKAAAEENGRSSKKIDDDLSRLAKRTNQQFDAMKFTGLTVGLPAAAAVGAAGTAASLGLITAGFAALGVAGVAKTAEVQNAVGGLKDRVVNDVQAMSRPLTGDVVGALDQFGAAWVRIRPLVAQAVQGSAPAIEELAGTVTDLAENAMPGMVTAVGRSGPALAGLRAFAGQTGAGLSDFFENVSTGSAGAERGLTVFGGTVETLAGRLGSMFANLANGSERPLRSLDVIVDEITDGLVQLTAQGSGALGFLQGFGSAGAGLATILHGALAAVSAMPPQVTQFAGSIGAASMVLGKFGVDAGAGFEGLGGKIKAAEGAGGKFKATMSGLAGAALNPATAATAGLGVALLLMGQDAERAARASATLEASQRSYVEALRASKGAIDANVRASVAQDLAQKTINGNSKSLLDFAKQYGVALPQVTSAVMGETGALDAVNRQLDAYAKANPDAATTVHALKAAIAAKGVAFRESTDSIAAEASATNQSAGAQNTARDAVNALTQAIYTQQNAQLGYRGAVLNSRQALDEWVKVSRDGKATAQEKERALLGVEQAFAAEEQAAYQAAYANSASKDETVRVSEALAAQNRETLNLASSWSGPLPASLQQSIAKMSVADLMAAGVKVSLNNLGQAVAQLPGGKNIVLTSNAAAEEARVAALRAQINALHDRDVKITVTTFYGTEGRGASLTGPRVARADGGLAGYANGGPLNASLYPGFADGGMRALDIRSGGRISGPGTGRSDSVFAMSSRGPLRVSNTEYVVNAQDTAVALPLLDFINGGGLRRLADGGLTGPVVSGTVSRATWDGLYAAGWRGDPTDGMEALYPPAQAMYTPSPVQRAIASGAARSGGYGGRSTVVINQTINVPNYVGNRNELISAIRSKVADMGGDVQKALGRRG